MNVYDKAELERIGKKKDANDRLEEYFNNKRKEVEETTSPLFKVLHIKPSAMSTIEPILDAQSTSLAYRQTLYDQINFFLNKRGKEVIGLKQLKQDKFIFYATGFGVKTNLSEKTLLIDAHLSENERCVQLYESHIDYLRDTIKNLESLSYAIKNMVDLMNYLSRTNN